MIELMLLAIAIFLGNLATTKLPNWARKLITAKVAPLRFDPLQQEVIFTIDDRETIIGTYYIEKGESIIIRIKSNTLIDDINQISPEDKRKLIALIRGKISTNPKKSTRILQLQTTEKSIPYLGMRQITGGKKKVKKLFRLAGF